MKMVSENVFRVTKKLLETGSANAEIEEMVGISRNTLLKIKRSKDYDDYKMPADKKPPEKADDADLKLQGGTLSLGYQINRIYEQLVDVNKVLLLISNKLGFIVDELVPDGGGNEKNAESDH